MSRDIVVEALWRVTGWGVGDRANRLLGRKAVLTGPWLAARPADRPLTPLRARPGTLGA